MSLIQPQSRGVLLLIVLTLIRPAAGHASDHVWSGAGANKLFSNPANWLSGGVPTSYFTNQSLSFPAGGGDTAIVDIPGVLVRNLDIRRNNFKLAGTNGGSIVLLGDANLPVGQPARLWSEATNVQFLASMSLVLSNAALVTVRSPAVSASIPCTDPLELFCSTNIALPGLNLMCPVRGAGVLFLEGPGQLELGGAQANTYAGKTHVAERLIVDLNKPDNVRAIAGDLEVWEGQVRWKASAQLAPTANVDAWNSWLDLGAENQTINGLDFYRASLIGTGRLTVNGDLTSGSGSILAPLNLGFSSMGARRIETLEDLHLYGEISGSGSIALRKDGPGRLHLHGTNSYGGLTDIVQGRAVVYGPGGFGALSNGTVIQATGTVSFATSGTYYEPLTFAGSSDGAGVSHLLLPKETDLIVVLGGVITVSNAVYLQLEEDEQELSNLFTNKLDVAAPVRGPGSLHKWGYGALRFSGTYVNTFQGGLYVEQGRVELDRVNGGLPVSSSLFIGENTPPSVFWEEHAQVICLNQNQIADAATVSIRRPGEWVLNNFNETIGDLRLAGVTLSTGTGTLTINGNLFAGRRSGFDAGAWPRLFGKVAFGSGPHTVSVWTNGSAASADSQFELAASLDAGVLSPITKQGPGELILISSNPFQGAFAVNEGRVTVKSPQALGTAFGQTTVRSNAVLELAVGGVTCAEPLSLYGGTVRFSAMNVTSDWGGTILVGAGENRFETADPLGCLRLTNGISGVGGFIKTGPGSLELSGAAPNTFTGPVRVENGPLRLAKGSGTPALSGSGLEIAPMAGGVNPPLVDVRAGNQIASSVALRVGAGGTLRLNNNNTVVGALEGAGAIELGAASLTLGGLNTDSAFSGVLSGNGTIGLVKQGTGTFTLAGNQPFTGRTSITAGRFLMQGTNGGGLITIAPNATLGGVGRVGPVSTTGGLVSPGTGPGRLHTGNLNWNSQLTYRCDLNGPVAGLEHDQLVVTGTVQLGGATLAALANVAGVVSNQFVVIDNDGADPVMGTFANLPEGTAFLVGGAAYKISYVGGTGNDVVITQTAAAQQPRAGSIQRLPNGGVQIGGTGIPGLDYAVYANTNLNTSNWIHLDTVTAAATTGALQFVDTGATNFPARFYRFAAP